MANKVGINISGLQADKKAFESRLGGCRSITRMLTNGINAMERGLDKTRLQNVKTKMDSVLEVQYTLERYYEWAIRVIDECIEKYQSVDSVLEKYAEDMYDKNGNIVNPSIGSEAGNSTQDSAHGGAGRREENSFETNATNKINSLTDGQYHTYPGTAYGYDYDCYSYSKWAFNEMYGCTFANQDYPNWRLAANSATSEVGSVSHYDNNLTLESLSAVLSDAKSGDVLQVVWYPWNDKTISTPHTMILKEVLCDGNGNITGITTLEGNNSGFLLNENDGFPQGEKYGRQHYYSIDTLFSLLNHTGGEYGGGGLSVNHSNNYDVVWK